MIRAVALFFLSFMLGGIVAAQTTPERELTRAKLFGDNYSLSSVIVTQSGYLVSLPTRHFVYNCPMWVLPEHRWYYPHCFMSRQQAFEEWNQSFMHPIFKIPICSVDRVGREQTVTC